MKRLMIIWLFRYDNENSPKTPENSSFQNDFDLPQMFLFWNSSVQNPSQIVKERGTSTRLGCLSRCDGSAVLMSELGSCCVGIIGPVEAKEKDQDPIKMICQVTLHPPSGKFLGPHRTIPRTSPY